mmetsp:Transcript_25696/g.67944  ORF Transcript_25696/g.67944 Transcript_25696/m.67944 type:complete len:272 (+) Transcript_25696:138-953(+)
MAALPSALCGRPQHKMLDKVLVDAAVRGQLRVEASDHDSVGCGRHNRTVIAVLRLPARVAHPGERPHAKADLEDRGRPDEDRREIAERLYAGLLLFRAGVREDRGLEGRALPAKVIPAGGDVEAAHGIPVLAPLGLRLDADLVGGAAAAGKAVDHVSGEEDAAGAGAPHRPGLPALAAMHVDPQVFHQVIHARYDLHRRGLAARDHECVALIQLLARADLNNLQALQQLLRDLLERELVLSVGALQGQDAQPLRGRSHCWAGRDTQMLREA